MTEPNERECIYAIQEQGSMGAWELTGHAFKDESQAHAYVDRETMRAILEWLRCSPRHFQTLAEWSKMDLEELEESSPEKISEVLKSLPQGHINEFADHLQCGGFFSYEALGIYDGEDPE